MSEAEEEAAAAAAAIALVKQRAGEAKAKLAQAEAESKRIDAELRSAEAETQRGWKTSRKKSHSPSSVLDEKSPPKSRYPTTMRAPVLSKTEEEGKDVEEPSKRKITVKVLTRAMILCNNEDKAAGRNISLPPRLQAEMLGHLR